MLDAQGGVLATTTTDQDGIYQFTVSAGEYVVEFMLPAGFDFTSPDASGNAQDALDSDASPANGQTAPFTVVAMRIDDTIDAGLTCPITITCPSDLEVE